MAYNDGHFQFHDPTAYWNGCDSSSCFLPSLGHTSFDSRFLQPQAPGSLDTTGTGRLMSSDSQEGRSHEDVRQSPVPPTSAEATTTATTRLPQQQQQQQHQQQHPHGMCFYISNCPSSTECCVPQSSNDLSPWGSYPSGASPTPSSFLADQAALSQYSPPDDDMSYGFSANLIDKKSQCHRTAKKPTRGLLTPAPSRRKSRAGRKPLSGVFGICRQDSRWVVSYRDDQGRTRHRYFFFQNAGDQWNQLTFAKRFLWKVVRLGRKLNPRDGEGLEEFVRSYESDGSSEFLGMERVPPWTREAGVPLSEQVWDNTVSVLKADDGPVAATSVAKRKRDDDLLKSQRCYNKRLRSPYESRTMHATTVSIPVSRLKASPEPSAGGSGGGGAHLRLIHGSAAFESEPEDGSTQVEARPLMHPLSTPSVSLDPPPPHLSPESLLSKPPFDDKTSIPSTSLSCQTATHCSSELNTTLGGLPSQFQQLSPQDIYMFSYAPQRFCHYGSITPPQEAPAVANFLTAPPLAYVPTPQYGRSATSELVTHTSWGGGAGSADSDCNGVWMPTRYSYWDSLLPSWSLPGGDCRSCYRKVVRRSSSGTRRAACYRFIARPKAHKNMPFVGSYTICRM